MFAPGLGTPRRLKALVSMGLTAILAAPFAASAERAHTPRSSDEVVEDLPALVADDSGTVYLATVRRGGSSRREVAVDAVMPARRSRVALFSEDVGIGRPAVVGLERGVAIAIPSEHAEAGYQIVVHRVRPSLDEPDSVTIGTGSGNTRPSLARVGRRLALAWESRRDARPRTIRVVWILPDGTLSDEQEISSPSFESGNPAIVAVEGGALFAVWDSLREDDYDLYGAWYRDGKWQEERRLTDDARFDRHARLTARGSEAWVAWESSAFAGNQPLDLRDHQIVVARVGPDGTLHETRSPFDRADVSAARVTRQRTADPPNSTSFETGLFRPSLSSQPNGRLWVTARQAIGRHGGWAPVLRSYEGDSWSEARLLSTQRGRWSTVPVVASGETVVMAVQTDDQPASWKIDTNRASGWTSKVEIVRIAETDPAGALKTRAVQDRAGDFDPGRRRRSSNAHQPRQSRVVGERKLHLYWGNLHAHSAMSVCNRAGNPPPLDLLSIERDFDRLDFCALTDHGFNLDDPMWQYTKDLVRQYNDPGRYLVLLGQEWTSGLVPPHDHGHPGEPPIFRHGHHNLIFRNRHSPRRYDASVGNMSPADLAADLVGEEFILIPHGLADWSSGGAGNPPVDWQQKDEVHTPLAEIYQNRGSYECVGCPLTAAKAQPTEGHYLQDAWADSIVIGVIAAPDHGGGEGYAGVWAEELTDRALFDAFHARHTFGTTGEKIALLVTSGDAMMGDKVRRPDGDGIPIDIEIAAAEPVESVSILRNNEVVFRKEFGTREVQLLWKDDSPPPNDPLWYYVRVQVAPTPGVDAARPSFAWSSPIWFYHDVPPPRRFPPESAAETDGP